MRFVNARASCERRRTHQSASNKRKEENVPVAAKTVPFASKSPRPEFSVLLNRVRELQPAVRAAARDTETNRRVSKRTMDLLREAELTKLVRPARFGGFEYGTSELAQIAFELGRACGSTGWCGSLAMCYQWMMSFFTLEAQQDVLGDPNNLVAGSYQPSKEVEIVPGGIKLAGAWPYASNCENSQWLMLGAGLPNAKGPPDVMWCLVPITDMKVDQDTWFTSGLQGTGSKTVRIERPVFVPDHRMLRFTEIVAGTVPGKKIDDNNMSKFGFTTFGPTALVSPVLGMAQGALDCFIEMAKTKVRAAKPGMIVPMAASPMIQNKIGAASATVESAFTLLLTSVAAAEDKVRNDAPLAIGERIAIRRNQGFAAKQSVSVVNDLFAKEGAAGSDLAAPLQRFWRDANAAALHLSLDWEPIAAMYGQERLGLEPVGLY
jgi:3-hydroxy-9,10-secoandrosta-1,3,5(10)-triene-9,17-dione monooxygenase